MKCPRCGGSGTVLSGTWARRRRLSTGMSLRAVATRMEITASYLCDLELGHRPFNPEMERRFRAAVREGQ